MSIRIASYLRVQPKLASNFTNLDPGFSIDGNCLSLENHVRPCIRPGSVESNEQQDLEPEPLNVNDDGTIENLNRSDADEHDTIIGNDNVFEFDGIFCDDEEGEGWLENDPQRRVFEAVGVPAVDRAVEGISSCIVTYGAAGTGKSHTVFGTRDVDADPQDEPEKGLTTRIAEALFDKIGEHCMASPVPDDKMEAMGPKFRIYMSIFDIYNDQIRDLLPLKTVPGPPSIGEHPRMGSFMRQTVRQLCVDLDDAYRTLAIALTARTLNETNVHRGCASTRGHLCITFHVEMMILPQIDTVELPELNSAIAPVLSSAAKPRDTSDKRGTKGGATYALNPSLGVQSSRGMRGITSARVSSVGGTRISSARVGANPERIVQQKEQWQTAKIMLLDLAPSNQKAGEQVPLNRAIANLGLCIGALRRNSDLMEQASKHNEEASESAGKNPTANATGNRPRLLTETEEYTSMNNILWSSQTVPWRATKLTHLLKDPLIGNWSTAWIGCIGRNGAVPETIATMELTQTIRGLKTQIRQNVENRREVAEKLKDEITLWKETCSGVGRNPEALSFGCFASEELAMRQDLLRLYDMPATPVPYTEIVRQSKRDLKSHLERFLKQGLSYVSDPVSNAFIFLNNKITGRPTLTFTSNSFNEEKNNSFVESEATSPPTLTRSPTSGLTRKLSSLYNKLNKEDLDLSLFHGPNKLENEFYLANECDDMLTSGLIKFRLQEGRTVFGRGGGADGNMTTRENVDVQLHGAFNFGSVGCVITFTRTFRGNSPGIKTRAIRSAGGLQTMDEESDLGLEKRFEEDKFDVPSLHTSKGEPFVTADEGEVVTVELEPVEREENSFTGSGNQEAHRSANTNSYEMVWLNGRRVLSKTRIYDGDVIIFGRAHIFRAFLPGCTRDPCDVTMEHDQSMDSPLAIGQRPGGGFYPPNESYIPSIRPSENNEEVEREVQARTNTSMRLETDEDGKVHGVLLDGTQPTVAIPNTSAVPASSGEEQEPDTTAPVSAGEGVTFSQNSADGGTAGTNAPNLSSSSSSIATVQHNTATQLNRVVLQENANGGVDLCLGDYADRNSKGGAPDNLFGCDLDIKPLLAQGNIVARGNNIVERVVDSLKASDTTVYGELKAYWESLVSGAHDRGCWIPREFSRTCKRLCHLLEEANELSKEIRGKSDLVFELEFAWDVHSMPFNGIVIRIIQKPPTVVDIATVENSKETAIGIGSVPGGVTEDQPIEQPKVMHYWSVERFMDRLEMMRAMQSSKMQYKAGDAYNDPWTDVTLASSAITDVSAPLSGLTPSSMSRVCFDEARRLERCMFGGAMHFVGTTSGYSLQDYFGSSGMTSLVAKQILKRQPNQANFNWMLNHPCFLSSGRGGQLFLNMMNGAALVPSPRTVFGLGNLSAGTSRHTTPVQYNAPGSTMHKTGTANLAARRRDRGTMGPAPAAQNARNAAARPVGAREPSPPRQSLAPSGDGRIKEPMTGRQLPPKTGVMRQQSAAAQNMNDTRKDRTIARLQEKMTDKESELKKRENEITKLRKELAAQEERLLIKGQECVDLRRNLADREKIIAQFEEKQSHGLLGYGTRPLNLFTNAGGAAGSTASSTNGIAAPANSGNFAPQSSVGSHIAVSSNGLDMPGAQMQGQGIPTQGMQAQTMQHQKMQYPNPTPGQVEKNPNATNMVGNLNNGANMPNSQGMVQNVPHDRMNNPNMANPNLINSNINNPHVNYTGSVSIDEMNDQLQVQSNTVTKIHRNVNDFNPSERLQSPFSELRKPIRTLSPPALSKVMSTRAAQRNILNPFDLSRPGMWNQGSSGFVQQKQMMQTRSANQAQQQQMQQQAFQQAQHQAVQQAQQAVLQEAQQIFQHQSIQHQAAQQQALAAQQQQAMQNQQQQAVQLRGRRGVSPPPLVQSRFNPSPRRH